VDKADLDKLANACGKTPDSVNAILTNYHGQEIKKVLQAKIGLAIENARTELEKCAMEDLTDRQGVIKGLRKALGCLEAGAPK
jgi:hypothetical protein